MKIELGEGRAQKEAVDWRAIKAASPNEGIAYIVHNVLNKNMSFTDACDEENYYGHRADIVAARNSAAAVLTKLGYKGSLLYKN